MTPAFGCTMMSGVRPFAGSPNLFGIMLKSNTLPQLSVQMREPLVITLVTGSTVGHGLLALSKATAAALVLWSLSQTKATSSVVTELPMLLPVIGSELAATRAPRTPDTVLPIFFSLE